MMASSDDFDGHQFRHRFGPQDFEFLIDGSKRGSAFVLHLLLDVLIDPQQLRLVTLAPANKNSAVTQITINANARFTALTQVNA